MKRPRLLVLCAAALAIIIAVANIVLGNLNLDEGWYLQSAANMAAGKMPYRDFFFTQAPLLPHVYGMLLPLWAPAGVLGGRIVTAVIGLFAALFAASGVRLLVPAPRRFAASLTVFALLACNVYHSYFTVIPKTYALASLWLTLGSFVLIRACAERGRNASLCAAIGGFFLAAAASTRLSLGIALPIAGLWLLATCRRHGFAWFFFGVGGFAGLGLFLLPYALKDWDAFVFANFFHGARAGGGLALTAGSISRLARNYLPAVLVTLAATAIAWRTGWAAILRALRNVAPLLAVFAGIFIVHALSPFPYDDYQVPGMPILVCVIASLFWNVLPEADDASEARSQRVLLAAVLAVSALCAFTSPLNESWVMVRKDRFWVEMKKEPDLAKLRRVGRALRKGCEDGELLTTDTYLAVEAGAPVPAGLEMGPFGYFPDLDDEKARRFHVLNRNLLAELAATTEAKRAAFSGYAFAMAAPEMRKIPEADREELVGIATSRFESAETIPDFGQEHTELRTWRKK
jgi:hypothetical protein